MRKMFMIAGTIYNYGNQLLIKVVRNGLVCLNSTATNRHVLSVVKVSKCQSVTRQV